jgi:hypothetical protein
LHGQRIELDVQRQRGPFPPSAAKGEFQPNGCANTSSAVRDCPSNTISAVPGLWGVRDHLQAELVGQFQLGVGQRLDQEIDPLVLESATATFPAGRRQEPESMGSRPHHGTTSPGTTSRRSLRSDNSGGV